MYCYLLVYGHLSYLCYSIAFSLCTGSKLGRHTAVKVGRGRYKEIKGAPVHVIRCCLDVTEQPSGAQAQGPRAKGQGPPKGTQKQVLRLARTDTCNAGCSQLSRGSQKEVLRLGLTTPVALERVLSYLRPLRPAAGLGHDTNGKKRWIHLR